MEARSQMFRNVSTVQFVQKYKIRYPIDAMNCLLLGAKDAIIVFGCLYVAYFFVNIINKTFLSLHKLFIILLHALI